MVQVPTAGFKYLCALKEWVCREFQKLNGLLCGPSSPADQEEGCWNIQTPFHLLSPKSCPALSESHAFHSHAGSIWYLSHFLAKYFFTGWFFFGFVVNCSHKNTSNFFFLFFKSLLFQLSQISEAECWLQRDYVVLCETESIKTKISFSSTFFPACEHTIAMPHYESYGWTFRNL